MNLIPNEILLEIINYLDFESFCKLSIVNKFYNNFITFESKLKRLNNSDEVILRCCECGDINLLLYIIKRFGINIRYCNFNALVLSIKNGYDNIFKYLMEFVCSECYTKKLKKMLLQTAIINNHVNLVEYILYDKLKVNTTELLIIATERGYIDILNILLKYYPYIHVYDELVILASNNYHKKVVELLLDWQVKIKYRTNILTFNNLNIKYYDDFYKFDLKDACANGKIELVNKLLMSIYKITKKEFIECIMLSATNNHKSIIRLLLSNFRYRNIIYTSEQNF